MERQHILTRESPPTVHAVIHETALHMRFGNTQMMRSELGTVVLEQPTGARYLSERTQLRRYGEMFERLVENALAPVDVSLAPEAHSLKDSLGPPQAAAQLVSRASRAARQGVTPSPSTLPHSSSRPTSAIPSTNRFSSATDSSYSDWT
ncbi:hypothetical protein SO3561_04523 [Streptomyces olivochromogenes]|uniref:DUF5753 domain-containing protein n=1 Tax=Streptomyces olivochromogenes TaxID=1963 RepID=A0A250VFL9_STROL|nr:hypothetical protein SO3561_04523 [Streptomyces olivochromogenes]